MRSYLYASDLMVWLWTILFKGQSCRAYNVGSEEALNIATLAREVATALPPESRRQYRIRGNARRPCSPLCALHGASARRTGPSRRGAVARSHPPHPCLVFGEYILRAEEPPSRSIARGAHA